MEDVSSGLTAVTFTVIRNKLVTQCKETILFLNCLFLNVSFLERVFKLRQHDPFLNVAADRPTFTSQL
jgi:hypothetical protein